MFSEKVRRTEKYPKIRVKNGKEFSGVDAVFFERNGGKSEDRKLGKKLVGAYAGLNVFTVAKRAFAPGSKELRAYMKAVAENITRAADYIGSDITKLTLLESRYGKGDDPHIVNRSTLENKTFYETLISEEPGAREVKIRKRAGDIIMTDDPDTPLAIVGADAHPVVIKALKPDGNPVVCMVVGTHQGLLQYGVIEKALTAMKNTYGIDTKSVQIDIGPGLGPSSIKGYDSEKHRFSGSSYEVGMDLAEKYMQASQEPSSPYYEKGLKFFDAKELTSNTKFKEISGSELKGNPIFRAHPLDPKKCVLDINALVQQTAALSGINPDRIASVGEGDFFSARGMATDLDLEALAQAHDSVKKRAEEEGVTPTEFLSKPPNRIYVNDGIGRNLFIAKILKPAGP